eukprot:scaffold121396_cov14-Tisochrysis_lutea.AAC.1
MTRRAGILGSQFTLHPRRCSSLSITHKTHPASILGCHTCQLCSLSQGTEATKIQCLQQLTPGWPIAEPG